MGIYIKRYPHEVPALIKYCDFIQYLASRAHNWKFYDENFRFFGQTHHSALPWNRIHDELWLSHTRFLSQVLTTYVSSAVTE